MVGAGPGRGLPVGPDPHLVALPVVLVVAAEPAEAVRSSRCRGSRASTGGRGCRRARPSSPSPRPASPPGSRQSTTWVKATGRLARSGCAGRRRRGSCRRSGARGSGGSRPAARRSRRARRRRRGVVGEQRRDLGAVGALDRPSRAPRRASQRPASTAQTSASTTARASAAPGRPGPASGDHREQERATRSTSADVLERRLTALGPLRPRRHALDARDGRVTRGRVRDVPRGARVGEIQRRTAASLAGQRRLGRPGWRAGRIAVHRRYPSRATKKRIWSWRFYAAIVVRDRRPGRSSSRTRRRSRSTSSFATTSTPLFFVLIITFALGALDRLASAASPP